MSSSTSAVEALEYLTDAEYRRAKVPTASPLAGMLTAKAKPDVVVTCPSRGIFLLTNVGARPSWLEQTMEGLCAIIALPAGWDSYGANRIDPSIVKGALRTMLETFVQETPPPSVVPTSRGGLQLEWHTKGIDLEVEFVTPSRILVSFDDPAAGESWDREFTGDLRPLVDAIQRLSAPMGPRSGR